MQSTTSQTSSSPSPNSPLSSISSSSTSSISATSTSNNKNKIEQVNRDSVMCQHNNKSMDTSNDNEVSLDFYTFVENLFVFLYCCWCLPKLVSIYNTHTHKGT
jgi:hypothetical protein